MKKFFLIGLLGLSSSWAMAQDPFARFEFLIGNWQGVESGVPGEGIGFRSYRFELDKNFIFSDNTSVFPISQQYPRGEVHRDFGIFSYDSPKSTTVLRQFYVEGFTNIFLLQEDESSADRFVFISREIENNPGGWVARLILNKDSDDEFREEFAIAEDGVNFSNIVSNHWERVD